MAKQKKFETIAVPLRILPVVDSLKFAYGLYEGLTGGYCSRFTSRHEGILKFRAEIQTLERAYEALIREMEREIVEKGFDAKRK